jgi:predicted  nucleic acid-binding Zn-ribbon protein
LKIHKDDCVQHRIQRVSNFIIEPKSRIVLCDFNHQDRLQHVFDVAVKIDEKTCDVVLTNAELTNVHNFEEKVSEYAHVLNIMNDNDFEGTPIVVLFGEAANEQEMLKYVGEDGKALLTVRQYVFEETEDDSDVSIVPNDSVNANEPAVSEHVAETAEAADDDVRVLGYGDVALENGRTITVEELNINGQRVAVIDVDKDGEADLALSDLNQNRQLDEGEVIDLHTGEAVSFTNDNDNVEYTADSLDI